MASTCRLARWATVSATPPSCSSRWRRAEGPGVAVAGDLDRLHPVTVLGGEQPGSTKSRFWAYIGDDEHPYTVYYFTMSRSRDCPAAFLCDY